jgi:hypothetical protein
MILIPFKLPFLVAAFWIWAVTGNEKWAAAAWASATFIIKLAVVGLTTSLPTYGILAFVIAWGVFYALSYLRRTVWLWPAGVIGVVGMIAFS